MKNKPERDRFADPVLPVNFCHYDSPLGPLLIAEEREAVCGLWFEGQKHFASTLPASAVEKETPVLSRTKDWLDIYFQGNDPNQRPKIILRGTPFQVTVWKILMEIPWGRTLSYLDIARTAALLSNKERMSARAVGNAVGRNPVSLMVPCHRVIGKQGRLTGYAGGLWRKEALLLMEKNGRPIRDVRPDLP